MGIEGYYEDYFDDRQDEKLTNFQKIKNMTLDEMAKFFTYECDCRFCPFREKCKGKTKRDCINTTKQWLQEESE